MQENKLTFDNFAARLRSLVATRGLPQKEIAELADITPAALSLYMSGKRFPKYGAAQRLAAVLGMPVELFLQADAALLNDEVSSVVRESATEYAIDWQARAYTAEEKLYRIEKLLKSILEKEFNPV